MESQDNVYWTCEYRVYDWTKKGKREDNSKQAIYV